jgi:hypothetical protein
VTATSGRAPLASRGAPAGQAMAIAQSTEDARARPAGVRGVASAKVHRAVMANAVQLVPHQLLTYGRHS